MNILLWFVFIFKSQILLLVIGKEMDEFSVVSFRLMALQSYHSGISLKGNSHPYISKETNTKQATAPVMIMC